MTYDVKKNRGTPQNPIIAYMELHELILSATSRTPLTADECARARMLCTHILPGFWDHPKYEEWGRQWEQWKALEKKAPEQAEESSVEVQS